MTDTPVISLTGVSYAYNGEPVIDNADLTVRHGDFASIIGPNGGGKTTLLKLLLGLLQPTCGTVRVFGQPPTRVRQRIGYLPQHTRHDPHFPASVMDVVLMGRLGRRLGGLFSRQDRRAARQALAEVGLEDLAGRPIADLSGGQQQRVLIARALCGQPELLLLDEPTASVDPRIGEKLFKILDDLNKRMTILLVSHDVGIVSQIVETVICVNRKVLVHPTSALTGKHIQEIYGEGACVVQHDRRDQ